MVLIEATDGKFYICDCNVTNDNEDKVVKDCNGNVLHTGDNIILNKDLKVKGGSNNTLKKGYKMRNIRIIDGGGGHDVEADGIMLKSQFLKKA